MEIHDVNSRPAFRLSAAVAIMIAANTHGASRITRYSGMCDASAAVPAGGHFFVVANDKDSTLRVFDLEHPGVPFYQKDFAKFLQVTDPEIDLEGGTRVGDRIYWITSHGAKSDGDPRSRRVLFATQLSEKEGSVALTAVGIPYHTLIEDLARSEQVGRYALDLAAIKPPESPDGLNIEGLSMTPTGGLMIGFRNPRPGGKALLVPLDNPDQVMEEGKAAKFGAPILLDLGGRGVRSIEYLEDRAIYLIVAGPHDDEGGFAVFEWTGKLQSPPHLVSTTALKGLNPEALVHYPDRRTHEQILSDDRGEEVAGERCLRRTVLQQSFRSVWLEH